MKKILWKKVFLLFSVMLTLVFSACENPFFADATKEYNVSFVTNCATEIDSYETRKIESIQKLVKEDYEFDGWYTNSSFNGDAIEFPYEVKSDTTFYARWIKVLTFDSAQINSSPDFVNGVLTLKPDYGKYIFKSDSSGIFNGLCIKISDSWTSKATIVFDNFSFTSSKSNPLIESPVDLLIEY
ncbi:MAG: InlB B-repeat-containing protein, partial [Treponema sp.]|uniref:InlB B-repeat-containing protein n=1 Tax=Treponema sp. TaxID=166 RepID=UPI00298E41D9